MFGNTLKKLRKRKKLTQKELAKMCGISTSYLQQLELGQKENPSIDIIYKLIEALDTTIEDLLTPNEEGELYKNIPSNSHDYDNVIEKIHERSSAKFDAECEDVKQKLNDLLDEYIGYECLNNEQFILLDQNERNSIILLINKLIKLITDDKSYKHFNSIVAEISSYLEFETFKVNNDPTTEAIIHLNE